MREREGGCRSGGGAAARSLLVFPEEFVSWGQATLRVVSWGNGSALTLSGGVNTNGNVLTINGGGNTTVSSPGISGGDGLTKAGAGTLTLGGANGYTGATQVSAGTLRITGSLTSPSGVVNVGGTSASEVATSGSLGSSVEKPPVRRFS